ncbi:MAG: carbon-nitrogen hydrolase family protein [Thermodesulfobacteriota bacterium]
MGGLNMKVTVCEFRNDPDGLTADWNGLVKHAVAQGSDWVVLPEMPFYPWIAKTDEVETEKWDASVAAHDEWMARLPELSAPVILGTRPVTENGYRFNEGFVWTAESGYRSVHRKYYLPNEPGFWEAAWYEQGPKDFSVAEVDGVKVGFLICTELWFNTHAREYMAQGVDVIVCPRVSPQRSTDKWIAGGRTVSTVSGAFCLSSNLRGPNIEGIAFGGSGWIIEPEEADVVGVTSADHPFLTRDIDPEDARKAKSSYPRYVKA